MAVSGIATIWTVSRDMHFEILVEDASGKLVLEAVLSKMLSPDHSCRVISYKGVGRVPKGIGSSSDPSKRILLQNLPRLLCGYGRSLREFPSAVVVVVDLDSRDCAQFKSELLGILDACHPKPRTLFRIAIEEIEAWLLGDRTAVETAFPEARSAVLDRYTQDSICGTWEVLADAVYPGGATKLKSLGFPHSGQQKCEWAERIAPHMAIESNQSKSFQVFRDGVLALATTATS